MENIPHFFSSLLHKMIKDNTKYELESRFSRDLFIRTIPLHHNFYVKYWRVTLIRICLENLNRMNDISDNRFLYFYLFISLSNANILFMKFTYFEAGIPQ